MHLIDKKEKEMTADEHLVLEVMRSLAVGRGFNLRDTQVDYDFRDGSNFSKMANCLLKRFNVTFKEKSDEKKMWPESEVKYTPVEEVVQTKKEKETLITGEDVLGEEDILNAEKERATESEKKDKRDKKSKEAE